MRCDLGRVCSAGPLGGGARGLPECHLPKPTISDWSEGVHPTVLGGADANSAVGVARQGVAEALAPASRPACAAAHVAQPLLASCGEF